MLVRKQRSANRIAFVWSATPIEPSTAPAFQEHRRVEPEHGFGRLVVHSVVTLATLAISALMLVCAAHAEIRVHGATTVAFGLMNPQKAKIEQLAGVEFSILPSSTTHGLADLAQGRADVAMLAEPLNWSELGGSNQPVLLVGEPTSSPYRLIKDALGISYAPDMRAVQNTNQIAIIVAQAPGAIGNISTAHDVPERSRLRVIETDTRIPLALYLAYRKDAAAEVERVVGAARSVGRP